MANAKNRNFHQNVLKRGAVEKETVKVSALPRGSRQISHGLIFTGYGTPASCAEVLVVVYAEAEDPDSGWSSHARLLPVRGRWLRYVSNAPVWLLLSGGPKPNNLVACCSSSANHPDSNYWPAPCIRRCNHLSRAFAALAALSMGDTRLQLVLT